jgi:hypothetical protein
MPNFAVFLFSQIRNHRRAELGIIPILGNIFKECFFFVKNKILASLKKSPVIQPQASHLRRKKPKRVPPLLLIAYDHIIPIDPEHDYFMNTYQLRGILANKNTVKGCLGNRLRPVGDF